MADERRALTYEDFWDFKTVSDPQVSPGGRQAAYVVGWLDRERDEQCSAIWSLDLESGESRQLTAGKKRDWFPRWSPDGQNLAFASTREEDRPQIYVLSLAGGEARRVTNHGAGAYNPIWCPEGDRLAFLVDLPSDEQRTMADIAWKDESSDREANPEARRLSTLKYRFDGRGYHDKRSHIFVVDLDGANERQLTAGNVDDTEPAWSPDGALIAFVSNRTGNADRNFASDIWSVDVDSGECVRLTDGDMTASSPVWSPDGQWVAFHATREWAAHGTQNRHLWVVSRASGDQRDLSPGFDFSMGYLLGDHGPAATLRPAWSPDGAAVFTTFSVRGSEPLYRVLLDGGAPSLVTEGALGVTGFALRLGKDEIILCASTCERPVELFRVPSSGGQISQLTDSNRELLKGVRIAPTERITARAEDGAEIDGWVVRPVRDTGQPTPLVLLVHGGPHSMFGNVFYYNVQVLAGAGITCAYFNPRGSSGYGTQFMRGVIEDWGGSAYTDLMRG
ncbi:MAG: prolyl oligopeptidase family serine peptidase, partial [Chloroflexi bacterium]|nr:prolyl oligopeptidase family serine peptidase [Chloroflexota bacterium]